MKHSHFKTFTFQNLSLVCTTKTLIQKLRDEGWQSLLEHVVSFCEEHGIPVPDMNGSYTELIRSRRKKDNVTVEHHYRVDVFIVAIDKQLQELNSRFNESVTELLQLTVALNPRNSYKSFNIDDICNLAEKFYPLDFTEQEKILLKLELQHYELDVCNHPQLKNASTISELCRGLKETEKSEIYPLIDRLVRLILTLPVSTVTCERTFSAMKIVKTRLRSSMADDFLKSYLIINIEREIAETFSTDKIIEDSTLKQRRVQLKMRKGLKEQGRLGRSFGIITLRDQPPSNTIDKIIAVKDGMRDVENYLQNLNVILLKIHTIILSGHPQITTEVALVLLSSAIVLLTVPFKYVLSFLIFDIFTRELESRREMVKRFMAFLKERWDTVPAASVVVLPYGSNESVPEPDRKGNKDVEKLEKVDRSINSV